MKTFFLRLPYLLLGLLFITSSPVVKAQSIEPDPQIVRAMTDYVHRMRKVLSANRQRISDSPSENFRQSAISNELLKATAAVQQLEHQAFNFLNEQRAQLSLPKLVWNENLSRVARLHSQNMASGKFFAHRGRDGKMVSDRAIDLDVTDWTSISENIAFNQGFRTPVEVACRHWMASAGHRENILDPKWTESGLGAAIAPDGTYYFTQVFVLH